jgi:hypothetical protein
MKKKQKLFLGFTVLITTVIITMAGCASFAEASKEKTFPEEFIGTWERGYKSNYTSTLTITSNTIQASNQDYYWILKDYASIEKGMYIIEASNDPTRRPNFYAKTAYRITIKLTDDGNLSIIDGDEDNTAIAIVIDRSDGTNRGESMSTVENPFKSEDNWTGTWKKK